MSKIDDAYQAIGETLASWATEEFAKLTFSASIYERQCGGMHFTATTPYREEKQLAFEWSGISRISNASIILRDYVLETTKQRAWGIKYSLYPDGKFIIEYDYNKPPGYEEANETTISDDINKTPPHADIENSPPDEGQLVLISPDGGSGSGKSEIAAALAWLRTQSAKFEQEWGLGSKSAWNLDMNAGTLTFSLSDTRVVVCPVQVVGTLNTADGSMLWAWDHPSVPQPLRRAALRLRDFGHAEGIQLLTTRKVPCNESEAWAYTALAAKLDDAHGAYRGRAGSAWVYMSFTLPDELSAVS